MEKSDLLSDPRQKRSQQSNESTLIPLAGSRTQDLTNRYVKKSREWAKIQQDPDSTGPRSQRRKDVQKSASYVGMDTDDE